jgi:hypothetical protein
MVLLEVRLDVRAKRELDRLAGGTRWGDHDHAARRRLGTEKRFVIRREVAIANVSNHNAATSEDGTDSERGASAGVSRGTETPVASPLGQASGHPASWLCPGEQASAFR